MPDKNQETYSIPESDRKAGKFDLASLFKKSNPKKTAPNGSPDNNEFKDKKEAIKDFNNSISDAKAERQSRSNTILEPEQSGSGKKESGLKQFAKNKFVASGNKWRAPKILKTNLIRGEVNTYIDWKKNLIALGAGITISIVLIAAIYGGLSFWETQADKEASQLENEIRIINQEIVDLEKEIVAVDAFQAKLDKIKLLLDKHIYWTNFFEFLEDNLLSNVFIASGFSGDTGGIYTLNIVADNYKDVTNQIKILEENEFIRSVSVKSAMLADQRAEENVSSDVVNFSIEVSFDPKIFNEW